MVVKFVMLDGVGCWMIRKPKRDSGSILFIDLFYTVVYFPTELGMLNPDIVDIKGYLAFLV